MYHPKKLDSTIGTALFLVLASLLGSTQKSFGQATLPLKINQRVITCFSGTSNNAVIPEMDGRQSGRSVRGVKTYQDRLYHGVWREDNVNASAKLANEIWSVALDSSSGQFLPNTAILEATLPPQNVYGNYSLPVASIDFLPTAMMLLAERYYRWNGVHQARVLSYTGTSGAWIANPVDQYHVGLSTVLYARAVVAGCEKNVRETGIQFSIPNIDDRRSIARPQ